jgi:hypothetical protein
MLVAGDWESIRSRTDAQARAGGSGRRLVADGASAARPGRSSAVPASCCPRRWWRDSRSSSCALSGARRAGRGPSLLAPGHRRITKAAWRALGEADSAFWSASMPTKRTISGRPRPSGSVPGGGGLVTCAASTGQPARQHRRSGSNTVPAEADRHGIAPLPWRDEAHWMEYGPGPTGACGRGRERLDRMAMAGPDRRPGTGTEVALI